MDIVNFPLHHPTIYWGFALVWSVIQSGAGYWYGSFIYDSNTIQNDCRPKYVKPFAYGFVHGAFYFICTIAGFTAWCLALQVAYKLDWSKFDWSTVTGGIATILTTLLLIALLGVSGVLPRVLFLGKKPL